MSDTFLINPYTFPSTATPSPPLNYSTVVSLPSRPSVSSQGINCKDTDDCGDDYCDNDDDDDDDNNDDDDYHCNLI